MLTVIVEACDCVGKSTLIGHLHKAIWDAYRDPHIVDIKEEHFTYPPKSLSKEEQIKYQQDLYYGWINDLITSKNRARVYLFDRFMTGELIYGPKYRGYTPTYIHELEKKLSIDQTYFITLCASPETIKSRFDGEFIEASHIEELNNRYIEEYNDSLVKHKMLLNVDHLNEYEVFTKVYDFIRPGLTRHALGRMHDLSQSSHRVLNAAMVSGALADDEADGIRQSLKAAGARVDLALAKSIIEEALSTGACLEAIYSGELMAYESPIGRRKHVSHMPIILKSFDPVTYTLEVSHPTIPMNRYTIHHSNITNVSLT